MNLLVSVVGIMFGIFVMVAPHRAAAIWGSERFLKLDPLRRVLFLQWYRAFGVILCLAAILFALDTGAFHCPEKRPSRHLTRSLTRFHSKPRRGRLTRIEGSRGTPGTESQACLAPSQKSDAGPRMRPAPIQRQSTFKRLEQTGAIARSQSATAVGALRPWAPLSQHAGQAAHEPLSYEEPSARGARFQCEVESVGEAPAAHELSSAWTHWTGEGPWVLLL